MISDFDPATNRTLRTLEPDGIQIAYLAWNLAGTTPVILLHGLADHAGVWVALGQALTAIENKLESPDLAELNAAVVAPDLRGHGFSSKPDTGYRFVDHLADLNRLMEGFGWPTAHVVGHSWGAKLACVWATQHPNRIRSLVLVDPFFNGTIPAWMAITFPLLYRALPFLKTMGPFATYDEAATLARSLKQYRDWSPLQQQVFQASMEQRADGSWGNRMAIAARDEIFADVMAVPGVCRPLDVPTLFIKPTGGLNRSALQLRPYRRYLSHLSIQELPGNHWIHLVNPQALNRAIVEFLTGI